MQKKQKEFIESAKKIDEKIINGLLFDQIYIINSGKNYHGFWGKNKFRKFIIIGQTPKDEFYDITSTYESDVLEIVNSNNYNICFDIPAEYDCIRAYFIGDSYYFKIKSVLSTFKLEVVRRWLV